MKRALVVFESMFGNTRVIAEAIAEGLRPAYDVHILAAGHAFTADLQEADLLVVGGPTHVRGMSRPNTRQGALEQLAVPGRCLRLECGATGPGLRELFATTTGLHADAAAFDTRVAMSPLLTGRASKQIAHALERSGCRVVVEPESFLVTKKTTMLLPGEEARARDWAALLADVVLAHPSATAEGGRREVEASQVIDARGVGRSGEMVQELRGVPGI
jgi:hypothetical protein